MIQYVFLGRHPSLPRPAALRIARGGPLAATGAFIRVWVLQLWLCFFTGWHAWGHRDPDWLRGVFLCVCILVVVLKVSEVCAFIALLKSDAPYVKMDKSGVAWSLPIQQSQRWANVAACACKNDNSRTILRLLLRGKAGKPIDIDFALAARPKQALDEAMVACAAWIVATRDPSETESPIREFVDKPPAPSAWQSRPPKPSILVLWMILVTLVAVVAVAAVAEMSRPVREEPPMPVDGRPEQTVLFLGNSRIAYNDLPKMVRDVADSAHSPIRYDMHMRAWGAATLRQHWNDGGDRALLQKPWALVILQPQSAAFMDGSVHDTDYYGVSLSFAAEATGSRVALLANWGLGPSFFSGDSQEAAAAARSYAAKVERDTRTLAKLSKAGVIDVEGAFAEAEASIPDIALTEDGNHPTHAGTFLAALVIYGYLSHADLSGIDWRPYDMSKPTAAKLKAIAARHWR